MSAIYVSPLNRPLRSVQRDLVSEALDDQQAIPHTLCRPELLLERPSLALVAVGFRLQPQTLQLRWLRFRLLLTGGGELLDSYPRCVLQPSVPTGRFSLNEQGVIDRPSGSGEGFNCPTIGRLSGAVCAYWDFFPPLGARLTGTDQLAVSVRTSGSLALTAELMCSVASPGRNPRYLKTEPRALLG